MTLLQLIQQTCQELALDVPTLIVGSQDQQTVQLFALLNRHGHDLTRNFEWEKLDKQYLLTTVAYNLAGNTVAGSAIITGIPSTANLSVNFGVTGLGINPFAQILSIDSATQVTMDQPATMTQSQTLQFSQVGYPLPSDWLKQIPQTEWDRTNRWPLMGPKSPQEWQSYKSGVVYAGPRERFRIQANAIQISPPPPNALIFAYEYISANWAYSATNVGKPYFTADTDTCIYDDSLMVAGLKLRWMQAKGLDYSFNATEYGALLQACMAQDKSAPKLSLSPVLGEILMTEWNVQDGNWPGAN